MNRFTLTLILLFLSLVVIAQAPLAFNYQGIARDGQGNIYSNRQISLEISLARGFEAGPVDFAEEQFVTTNEFGLFTVQIGRGDPVLGNLDAIEWGNNQYYINLGFDPNGGRDFTNLGTTQLLSVPYAMHARTAANAAGGSGDDDQLLDLNGSILSIENGNSVDLGAIAGVNQTLSIEGDQLSISDGNSVMLPTSSPQTLSINGDQLSISSGNTVTLPSGGGGSSPWQVQGNQISYHAGPVNVKELLISEGFSTFVDVRGALDGGLITINNDLSNNVIQLGATTTKNGALWIYNENGNRLGFLGSTADGTHGWLELGDASGNSSVRMLETTSHAGFVGTSGPNRQDNVTLTNLSSNGDHGFVAVKDANGETKGSLFVNSNGQGQVNADITAAVTPHPGRADQQIVYAALSGPEAAAYMRGKADLVDGRATIKLPEHFTMMANTSSMTIMLTPYSLNSKGLAVMNKSETGFEIGELHGGQGNYSFDWEVKAVRKGCENFKVIQQVQEIHAAN